MLKNLRYINAAGGILADNTETGVEVYLRPGDLLYSVAVAGQLGPVAPYVPPPDPVEPPTFADADAAIAALSAWVSEFVSPLIRPAPQEERDSWPVKELAAHAQLAGTATPEQIELLQFEAQITGETLDALAAVIIAAAQPFRRVSASIAGLRRKVSALLRAEPDPYKFDAILEAAKAEAQQMAVDLGVGEILGIS